MAAVGPMFGITRMQSIRAGMLLAAGGEFAFVAFGQSHCMHLLQALILLHHSKNSTCPFPRIDLPPVVVWTTDTACSAACAVGHLLQLAPFVMDDSSLRKCTSSAVVRLLPSVGMCT